MKTLIIKAKYGQMFTHFKLPKLFLKLVVSELNKPENLRIISHIQDTYKIPKVQLIAALRNNVKISGYADNIIISFNNVKLINNDKEEVYLETIVNFINYGNREVRGNLAINKIISYLEDHIDTLYILSKVKGGSEIWQ